MPKGIFKRTPEHLKNMYIPSSKGYKHSPELRKQYSDRMRGSKNPNWKGGVSKPNLLLRASAEYRIWRNAVFERDGFTCVWCGATNGQGKAVVLHADHIKPFAYFPELRFAIDNGRTLCRECHKTTDSYGVKNNYV